MAFLWGLFGGGKPKGPNSTDNRRDAMYGMLQQDARRAQAATPTTTTFYNTGMGTLADILRQRQQGDAGQAAARGLTGAEFEIAQAGARSRMLGDAQRGLLSDSEQMLMQDRNSALSRLMGGQDMLDQAEWRKRMERMQKQQMVANALSSAVGLGGALLGGGGK